MTLPKLKPGETIGIVGGGQLGQMLALSASEMGFKVGILDPVKNCPASHVANWQIVAEYNDHEALKKLAKKTQVITYEFENVSAAALKEIEKITPVPQGTLLLEITQDRLLEKNFLQENKIPLAPFKKVSQVKELSNALEEIGYPCVLKTTRGGYDGKGQVVLKSSADISTGEKLLTKECVLEKFVPFTEEISVMVVGNGENFQVFPLGENHHVHNILRETIVRKNHPLKEKAETLALKIAQSLKLTGCLGIEMFVKNNGEILVNELAPRPHNSGHYSIEACNMSQFDAHIRGICSWPLPEVTLLSEVVMVNILGEHLEKTYDLIFQKPHWQFHYYGKSEAKVGRKMGHITILTKDIPATLIEIEQTKIW